MKRSRAWNVGSPESSLLYLRWTVDGRLDQEDGLAILPSCPASRTARRLFQQSIKHLFTRPYTPRTNGKAERFIQTAIREWAYARTYQISDQRHAQLDPWLHDYNFHRQR